MDFQQLRVFQAAVKSGGFTKAGELLHLSQSTVSLHVKQLEESLGCPLFMRVGKRAVVNQAGNLLLRYVDRIFREMKNAEMAVRDLTDSKRGTVRLGVGPTTLTYRLPHVLADYKRRFPQIELIVLAGTTDFLIQSMRSENLDLAVVMQAPVPASGLSVTPLGREELVVVLHREHPFASKSALEPANLASLPFILYERYTAMQSLIDQFFARAGVTPRIIMEVENNEAIKSLVSAGLGASILPLCAVSDLPPTTQLKVLRVKGIPLMRQLMLLAVDAEFLPNAIRDLGATLVTALGSNRANRRDRSSTANKSI